MYEAALSETALPCAEELRTLDPDSWEQLYLHARPVLWRFARLRLATADQAEDAVSETMVRAMSAIDRFAPDRRRRQDVVAWLLGIERNVINEAYRAGRRLRAVPDLCEEAAAESIDPVVAAEESRALRVAFAELPSDDQELLGLRIVGRLDAAAAGRVLGKRPGAVRMAQARALGRLRVTLSEGNRER